MTIFQGLLFLFFGVGLLLVNYRALTSGWLPCGPNGIKGRLEFRRDTSPLMFWLIRKRRLYDDGQWDRDANHFWRWQPAAGQ